MKNTLFDAAQSVREAVVKVDPETGEIVEAYAASRELFDQKASSCVAYYLDESAQIEAARSMLKAMQAQLEARQSRLERFHRYIADCMRAAGARKIEADGLASATLYPERDVSVEIAADAVIPIELCADPKPPAPSKSKLRAAIEAGQPLPDGVRLVRRDRLTIK